MIRVTDFFGWAIIFILFYALTVFSCVLDSDCSTFFMEPI